MATKWIEVTLKVYNAKYNPPEKGNPKIPDLKPVNEFIVFVEGKECELLRGDKTAIFFLRPGQYNFFVKELKAAKNMNEDPFFRQPIKITGHEKGKKIKVNVSLAWS